MRLLALYDTARIEASTFTLFNVDRLRSSQSYPSSVTLTYGVSQNRRFHDIAFKVERVESALEIWKFYRDASLKVLSYVSFSSSFSFSFFSRIPFPFLFHERTFEFILTRKPFHSSSSRFLGCFRIFFSFFFLFPFFFFFFPKRTTTLHDSGKCARSATFKTNLLPFEMQKTKRKRKREEEREREPVFLRSFREFLHGQ